jgi:hypothetical protein
MEIRHIQDIRNYKVAMHRARNVLSFHPDNNIRSIVCNLIENMGRCNDWDNPRYYNIQVFKNLEEHAPQKAMSATGAGR